MRIIERGEQDFLWRIVSMLYDIESVQLTERRERTAYSRKDFPLGRFP